MEGTRVEGQLSLALKLLLSETRGNVSASPEEGFMCVQIGGEGGTLMAAPGMGVAATSCSLGLGLVQAAPTGGFLKLQIK